MHLAPPIECRDLTRYYGKTRGIEGLDLTIEPGSVVGFLGPNGAGKTTVIRMLVGMLRPTSGSVQIFGEAPAEIASRRRLGYLPADPVFYPALTGAENLALLAELGGWDTPDAPWAADLLALEPLTLRRRVRDYSSGMKQKLGLIQAVQHRPELVILDEPANRLDPIAHRHFVELVRAIAAKGRTVFLSSHTLAEVEAVCDRVAMVRDGRLLLSTSVKELLGEARRLVTVTFRTPPPKRAVPKGLIDPKVDGRVVRARLEAGRTDVLRELLASDAIEDVMVESASLEEAFLHLYEGGLVDGPTYDGGRR